MSFIQENYANSILELSLNIGEGNGFTVPGFEAFETALNKAAALPDIRALIITSALPDTFSNGLNPNAVHGQSIDQIEKLIGHFFAVLKAIHTFPVPVIAALNGHAIGYGAMVGLMSDFRLIVDKGARVSFPELNIGISLPSFVTLSLQDLVGTRVTRDLLFSGLAPKPPEALELGLVDEIVEKEKLMDRARQMAKRLAALPRNAVRSQKEISRWRFDLDLDAMLERDRAGTLKLLGSAEALEGFSALVEKRRPRFD